MCKFSHLLAHLFYLFIIRDLFTNSRRQELQDIDKMPVRARQVMETACHKHSIKRPTFEQLEKSIRNAISGGQTNLLDRFVHQEILITSKGTRQKQFPVIGGFLMLS